ncbi:MAG TPA: DUF166 family protein [Anaerolineae bacterium]
MIVGDAAHSQFRVLAVTQSQWGERIARNIQQTHPAGWEVHHWPAPRALPLVVDDPGEFLPPVLPRVDLVLALGDTAGVPQLIPDIVKLSGARAVIAPIDRNESLPPGLVEQLRRWLADLHVAVVFPKPFCSLTETTYNYPPIVVTYADPLIGEFAAHYGMPRFRVSVHFDGRIGEARVERDAACGCARAVALGLAGCPVDEAEYQAGMLHHHFPCLASMNQDADYADTLMHVSGRIVREAVNEQVKDHLEPTPYFRPIGRVDEDS